MKEKIVIFWFRQDLRLADNPALSEAAAGVGRLLPIYILDDTHPEDYAMGGASRWWLHHSLASLKSDLNECLSFYCGSPMTIFSDLLQRYEVATVCWNRCYEPWRIERDKQLKHFLQEQGVEVISCNGSLLWEPWKVLKSDGTPYKVFTPFFRNGCLSAEMPRKPLSKPKELKCIADDQGALQLNDLGLLPKIRWDEQLKPHWEIGEKGASKKFRQFVAQSLTNYKQGRNFPAEPYVSKLSPHIHFGEVSPNQLWHGVGQAGNDVNVDCFQSELGWREFSYSLLYHFPNLPKQNLQAKFDNFPWASNTEHLRAWQQGQTGVPMVDAGMRELWQTGSMHNRVRMIVGSFLVKNLRLHWHHGERWFWDTLVDADLANNSAGWQWIAGCGADAAPYFRIFNPVTQGQKFDPDGIYIRKYIPEIASLPDKYLFNPWEAPEAVLQKSSIEIGKTYPAPIVSLKSSRAAALQAFQSLS